jgi:hypothetical protein
MSLNKAVTILCVVVTMALSGCGANPLAPEGPVGDDTDTLTWEFINSTSTQVDLRFFDINYGAWYPSRSEVYVLDPAEDKTYRLECNKGATICYGASVRSNRNQIWGKGSLNDHSCGSQGCCHVCDGAKLTTISLTPPR